MIYIIALLWMLVAAYLYDLRGYKTLRSFSFWGIYIFLVLIAGLRYRIGTDSVTYENTYEIFPKIWELATYNYAKIRFEPGFLAFASITRTLSPDFVWFQLLHATVVNLVIFLFIRRNTRHVFIALSFYFIVLYLALNTQVLRESLAVCCFLLAWPFFRDGRWLVYYLLALLAITFHVSASLLLFLPLFTLPGIRSLFVFGKRTFIICALLLAFGYVIQTQFKSFFMLLSVTDTMADRVNSYSKSTYGGGVLNLMGILGILLRQMAYPAVALYFFKFQYRALKNRRDLTKEDILSLRSWERWQILCVIGIYFIVFTIPIFIFHRYFNYFGLFLLITVASWVFSRLKVKGKTYRLKFAYWVVILLPFYLLSFMPYNVGLAKSGRLKEYMIYYPYSHRFDPQVDQKREEIYRYVHVR